MSLKYWVSAIILISSTALWAQDQGQKQQGHEEQKEQQEHKRPTLGPTTEPSLSGPHTSTTSDPRRLLRIQKIYVESIDNFLSDKLVSGLAKTIRFKIVTQRNEADAVLHGTCFDSHRLKVVHSEVYINDRASGAAIWQDSVRRPFNPPPLARAVDDTAARILSDLSGSLQEAQRK